MVAPMFGLYDLEFLLEKTLSVKVPINKEENRIVGVIFGKIEVWFLGLEVAEMLDFSRF